MVVVALGEPGLPMTSAACVIDAIRPAMARTQPSRRLTRASAFGDFIASIVSIFPKARCVPKARFNSSDATRDIARTLSATGDGIKPINGRSPVWRQRVRELRDPHRGHNKNWTSGPGMSPGWKRWSYGFIQSGAWCHRLNALRSRSPRHVPRCGSSRRCTPARRLRRPAYSRWRVRSAVCIADRDAIGRQKPLPLSSRLV